MSGYVHWITLENGSSTTSIICDRCEEEDTVTLSLEAVTCPRCREELSRRLRMALSAEDSRWLEVDWSNTDSVRTWAEGLWTTNWRLHAEGKELREQVENLQRDNDVLTGEKVEEFSRRLMRATLNKHEEEQHEEEQYAKSDPECAGCKRWTHRIKVLEERVEYARKVLEGR